MKHTPGEPVGRSITLAKYIDVWLEPGGAKETGGQYTGAGYAGYPAYPASAGALHTGKPELGNVKQMRYALTFREFPFRLCESTIH